MADKTAIERLSNGEITYSQYVREVGKPVSEAVRRADRAIRRSEGSERESPKPKRASS